MLDLLPGQNIDELGSSETEETALTVMACTSSPARATMTATPVANSPMMSRKRRASGAAWALLMSFTHCPIGGMRRECFVLAFFDERSNFLGVLLNLSGVTRDQRSGHAYRIAEEEALV